MRSKFTVAKGTFYQKTVLGYLKEGYLILKNKELYIYSHKSKMEMKQLLVLSPNVFVTKLKETNKYFPVELWLGGNDDGLWTLYFET
jgi:hypothetical protein